MFQHLASHKLTILTVGFLLLSSLSFAQTNRNKQVRGLNSIVDYMDEASRINQLVYFDLLNFSQAYLINKKKRSPNYWYSKINATGRMKSGSYTEFPQVKPDKEGFINDYDATFLPLYRAKNRMDAQLLTAKITNPAILSTLKTFTHQLDSLVNGFKQLVDYVHNKKFASDSGFSGALQIIELLTPAFQQYKKASDDLYKPIEAYYTSVLKPAATQIVILQAEQELLQPVSLLQKWEQELYNDNDESRLQNDLQLRALYEEGRKKDSFYLSKTYGYKYLSNGAFPHSRYKMFYSNMPSTIFWFKTDTAYQHKQLQRGVDNYNKYVNRYNWVIHYYNNFIENADGAAMAKTHEYSMKMAADVGMDTAQNVLLKKPRIGYRFTLVNQTEKQVAENNTAEPLDTIIRNSIVSRLQQVQPNHTVYLLDVSNSMKEQGRLDSLKKSILYLLSLQRQADRISLIEFADEPETILNFIPCNNLPFITQKIKKLATKGGTNATDAIAKGYQLIDSIGFYAGLTKLMIITDGAFEVDKQTRKLLESKQKSGVILSILLLSKHQQTATTTYFNKLIKKGMGQVYTLEQNSLQDVLIQEAGR
ncbi:MAG: VWA domain-containing protein [Sphingobacteriales bacterium]|nr:MAG: VWA domain-containing protein [Sphingobacteriales bacterium]